MEEIFLTDGLFSSSSLTFEESSLAYQLGDPQQPLLYPVSCSLSAWSQQHLPDIWQNTPESRQIYTAAVLYLKAEE